MDKFICVFSATARDILVSRGYVLIRSDDRQSIYVFQNRENCYFDLNDVSYVFSNTLTF